MHKFTFILLAGLLGCAEQADPIRESSEPAEEQSAALKSSAGASYRENETTELFRLLGRNASWTLVDKVAVDFPTFHTQGMLKIGDTFYVSSVEIVEGTVRNGAQTDSLYDFTTDRSAGVGRGWLFKFDATGHLLGKVELSDGDIYHPGGIDFDGEQIWVPVAEYRPNSRSNVYRVDPDSLTPKLVFSAPDHIGGIVRNVHRGTMHGVSWGSRRFYSWLVLPGLRGRSIVLGGDWTPNPSFYVDYQDCHYQGVEYMLCGGIASFGTPRGSIAFGGLDLVDLRTNKPSHQVPVNQFIDEGTGPNPNLALSHNAFWAEPGENGKLRVYFMAESDNQADLLVYDAAPWLNR